MFKKITALLLTLALVTAALPICAAAETMTCTVGKGHYVNVRTAPTTSAAANGRKVHGGDEIEVISVTDNGWIAIDWNGVTAYVQARYFEARSGIDYTVEANGRVRWRKTPAGEVGGYYRPGEVVTVDAYTYGADGGMWGRIGNRYVSMDFLTPYETEDEKEFYAREDYSDD